MWLLSLLTLIAAAAANNLRKRDSPIDGGWSAWKTTSYCSKTCGGGLMLEQRACNSPAPSGSGRQCSGPDTRETTTKCNEIDCPFNSFASALMMMDRVDLLSSYTSAFQTLIALNSNATSLLAATPPQLSLGTCTMTGDPHVTTFDQTHYSFYGACVYYAVYDSVRSLRYPRFNIQVETVKCGAASCVQSATINVFPCPTSSQSTSNATLTPSVIKIDALSGGVSIDGNDVTGNLPELIEDARVIVHRDGPATTATCYCNYNHGSFTVRWMGQYNIEVQVGSSVQNQIVGLCGKWDGNKNNDFTLIDGTELPWSDNLVNTPTIQKFTESYQLPGHESSCTGPPAPVDCKTPYADTSLYCDVFRRGEMGACNADPTKVYYVDPAEVQRECFIDVCLEPDDDSKAKRACVYYVKYAMECSCKGVIVDLKGYQGCKVPTVSLTPSSQTVWEGCPASFQCTSTGWPPAPIQWTHDGKDVDLGSRKEIACNADRTSCTLKIGVTNATVDPGKYTCWVNNYVGKASASSTLAVRSASFSVSAPPTFLVGSTVSVEVSKSPANNPASTVRLDLVDSNSQFVVMLVAAAPSSGHIDVPLRTLPTGAAFGPKYRIRASWNQSGCDPFVRYSKDVEFVRGVINGLIPVDKSGKLIEPPMVYFGTRTSMVWDYDKPLTFLSFMDTDFYHKNGTFYTVFAHHILARSKQRTWFVGLARYLYPGEYYVFFNDSQTGAQGRSNVFTLTHADVCIVTPTEVAFGTNANVFVKVEPEDVAQVALQYYLTDERCDAVFYNLTDEISGFPHATWRLPTIVDGTLGRTFRLRAQSGEPSYLSACSDNTIQFRYGTIWVEIVAKSSTVYVNQDYSVTFKVEDDLIYLRSVQVTLICTSGVYLLASNVSKTVGEVTWHVGRESATPIQSGDVCSAFVTDTGSTGASGFSRNVTVAKICVVADPVFDTTKTAAIGVSGLADNPSDIVVTVVTADASSKPLLVIDNKDLVYGDNLITWPHPIEPSTNESEGTYRIRVENKATGGYGLSETIQFTSSKKKETPKPKPKPALDNESFIGPDSPGKPSKTSGHSNAGVIAGAVIGSIVGLLVIVGIVMKVKRKREPPLLGENRSHVTDGGTISWKETSREYDQIS